MAYIKNEQQIRKKILESSFINHYAEIYQIITGTY